MAKVVSRLQFETPEVFEADPMWCRGITTINIKASKDQSLLAHQAVLKALAIIVDHLMNWCEIATLA